MLDYDQFDSLDALILVHDVIQECVYLFLSDSKEKSLRQEKPNEEETVLGGFSLNVFRLCAKVSAKLQRGDLYWNANQRDAELDV